jgi:signal transduction histidine kinase
MRVLMLFIFSISIFQVEAQSRSQFKIDSLLSEVKTSTSDTSRVHSLSRLAQAYEGQDSTLAFDSAFKALKLAEEIEYQRGIAHATMTIGGAYMEYYDPDKAEEYLKRGIEKGQKVYEENPSKENLKMLTTSKYNLAITYSNRGNHDKEIALVEEVIPIVKKQKDSSFLANIHNNLGITYMNLGQTDESYRNFKLSEELYVKLDEPQRAIFNQLSFATLLYSIDSVAQMKQVLKNTRTNLEITPESSDWHLYHTQMGLYYTKIKQFGNAIASYDKALKELKKNKLMVNLSPLYQKYAFTYELKGDYQNAIKYINKYLDQAIENKKKISEFQGYYKRSQFEASQKNWKNAYNDYVTAIDIYDSLQTSEHITKLKDLDLKYETAEKEKEILALKNTNNESELSLEKKKSQAYLLGGLASILSLLLFGGYYVYNQRMRKARKKEREQEAEVELLKQEQQNKIFSAMIEGQEKERKRLAIDLHDGLGGRLSGISMNLSKLDKDEPKQYPKKQLQKVMKDLNDSLSELRSIARNMMPETLVKFGLQAALKDYCSSMTGSDTKVTLQFYGTDKGIDINQQVTMYRVIQELINNAIKHAKATEVLVQFIREDNQVDITVEDNGVGFNKNKSLNKKDSGMGLSNLQTRVAYLKGNIDFESEENEGTTVNVHINIDAA